MAADISSVRKKKPCGFMTLLSSAACEWFLMFLLFVDAALSYLLVKFARYYELETPCLLCSRFDNGFGEKKPGFYWSLLCNSHREEISSLVSCSIHGKFADNHGMCEECLTPIATQNKSNSETYRLLVGKSWLDIDRSAFQNLVLNKQIICSSDVKTCSCCKKTWRAKSSAERLLEVNPIGFGASKANVKPPLPRAPGSSRFSRRDSFKRLRDKVTGQVTNQSNGRSNDGAGTLYHVGYTKLKISSDSESEFPFSEDDDDGANTDYSSKTYGYSEHNLDCNSTRLYKSLTDSESPEKRMDQGYGEKPSTLEQPYLDFKQHDNVDTLSSDVIIEHTLIDHKQEESCHKHSPPELSPVCDVLQQADVAEGSFGASSETSKSSDSVFDMPAISVLSELLSLCSVSALSSDLTIPYQGNNGGTCEKVDASGANRTDEGTSSDDDHLSDTNSVQQIDASNQTDKKLELSDRNGSEPFKASDSATLEVERSQVSNSELGLLSKGTSHRAYNEHDESRTDEDSSSWVLPVSASKDEGERPQVSNSELGSFSEETSQKAHKKHDEPRTDEDSSSQVLPVSALLKKSDSTDNFLDEITMSNAEGEDIVEQLKRQIENDRKTLSSLYKELEEERNAAAIAANEAMAMITRLQEEKAALHMEASQYLRMMDEQAEYDMEALDRANDLLAEKDKELQDLEYELEFYRNNVPDNPKADSVQETSSLGNGVAAHTGTSPSASSNPKAHKILRPNGNCKPVNSSVSDLQDESIYPQDV